MKVLYDTILKATYTGRPNRFVVTLDLNGESVLAHLPNPLRPPLFIIFSRAALLPKIFRR